jgi:hypothetical protein
VSSIAESGIAETGTAENGQTTVSVYDARPFFEKALQYGLAHGIINAAKLDAIRQDAPKGMVQIAPRA